MRKLLGTLFVGTLLMAPAVSRAVAQDRDNPDQTNAHRYYDRTHKDYHNWDPVEDRAYRLWVADQHRSYVEFNTLPPRDQGAYWVWRHNHSNAVLKIDVQ